MPRVVGAGGEGSSGGGDEGGLSAPAAALTLWSWCLRAPPGRSREEEARRWRTTPVLPIGTWRSGRSRSSLRAWRRPAGERHVRHPPALLDPGPSGWPPPPRMAGWGEPGTSQLPPLDLRVVASDWRARVGAAGRERVLPPPSGGKEPAPTAQITRCPLWRKPLRLFYHSRALKSSSSLFGLLVLPPDLGAVGVKYLALLSERPTLIFYLTLASRSSARPH